MCAAPTPYYPSTPSKYPSRQIHLSATARNSATDTWRGCPMITSLINLTEKLTLAPRYTSIYFRNSQITTTVTIVVLGILTICTGTATARNSATETWRGCPMTTSLMDLIEKLTLALIHISICLGNSQIAKTMMIVVLGPLTICTSMASSSNSAIDFLTEPNSRKILCFFLFEILYGIIHVLLFDLQDSADCCIWSTGAWHWGSLPRIGIVSRRSLNSTAAMDRLQYYHSTLQIVCYSTGSQKSPLSSLKA